MKRLLAIITIFAIITSMTAAQDLNASTLQLSSKIDAAIASAIEKRQIPGAVIEVGHRGKVIFRKAYGQRAIEPQREPMTEDTIFDLASLTKPLATGLSVMKLIESGKLRLNDPVSKWLPDFQRDGITIQHLLTHTSGLPPGAPAAMLGNNVRDAVGVIGKMPLNAPRGTQMVYSDLGFVLLGEMVTRAAAKPLDQFAAENIYQPLGLKRTRYRPPAEWVARIAPTEKINGEWRCGVVHDPDAFRLGGVVGHAGLFSTAEEVGRLAQMMLNGGELNGTRILLTETVRLMTVPMNASDDSELRGLSWDIESAYSGLKSNFFSRRSYGHTGFTGTSVWIDPEAQLYVVVLTNAVHLPKSETRPLRRQISDAVAESLCPQKKKGETRTGLDVLAAENFKRLEGRNVALIINHTSIDRRGKHILDLLPPTIKVFALLTPEHGLRGTKDELVASGKDERTGLPVFSLYTNDTKRPTDEMLRGMDTLVFDIQDIGARFYTYSTTMCYAMEEAAKRKMKFIVLDRPNPITASYVEGPVLDANLRSFTAPWELPLRHGLTLGELAMLYNAEEKLGANLEVVRCENWERNDWFDETGLPWVNPSPNMRNLNEATLYPCIGALENTNISVGRGTDSPFERFGAPFMDGVALAKELNALNMAGIRFYPVRFTPNASKYKNEECGGVYCVITDRQSFRPVRTGAAIATVLHRLYPQEWKFDNIAGMFGTSSFQERLAASDSWQQLEDAWRPALERFLAIRAKYLLY